MPNYLAREIPFLANRGGEALRAIVAACVLDHDDIATLALSIEGLKRVLAHAADPAQDPGVLPAGLPEPVVGLRALWHPVHRCRRPVGRPLRAPMFPGLRPGPAATDRPLSPPASPRRPGLDQGGPRPGRRRPWATVKARMRDVMLRTDLWSDQILVLRAVQSLTMLDVQHNCELVWALGGYTSPEPGGDRARSQAPRLPLRRDDQPAPNRPTVPDGSIASSQETSSVIA